MISLVTLPLVDGTRVVVPDSLDLITPYVLREQQDWFEDEIKFLRRILRPGQRVIDIGANYGVYTLSMARAVGPAGSVWAFEPASSTAALLAQSIAANDFTHVTLDRSALSSRTGTARLSLNENSELNELIRGGRNAGPSEEVPLTTLDECLQRHGWEGIAFLKIDAEGEEANIVSGGKNFFSTLSPLVMYEVKAGNTLHLELITAFSALGYRSYRLVPDLNLLTPFQPDAVPDPYLLNLFCCKADRAALLAADGYLVDAAPDAPSRLPEKYHWRRALAGLPYGERLLPAWEASMKTGDNAELETALALFAFSEDSTQQAGLRFAALESSFNRLCRLCEKNPARLRLASLSRVAAAHGARAVAVDAMAKLGNAILVQQTVDPGEPFLVPARRFDTVPMGTHVANWILAAVMEELERLGHYSSFYGGQSSRQRLEIIRQLGFASAEMQRRLTLVNQRFGLA
jgi:FkbM family methyltransferase